MAYNMGTTKRPAVEGARRVPRMLTRYLAAGLLLVLASVGGTIWLAQTSEIPAPRTAIGDFRSLDAVREVVRYQLARLERAVADTNSGYAAAIGMAVLLGVIAGLILALAFHIIVP